MTRRDLLPLSVGLLAATAKAQPKTLPSRVFPFESLVVKGNDENRSRAVFDGLTHSGFHVDMHQTEIAPGMAPHAAHSHEHEEMIMIREGVLEVTIEGKVTNAGPGSVVYVASNEMHGWKNIGTTRAHYFVLALGRATKAP